LCGDDHERIAPAYHAINHAEETMKKWLRAALIMAVVGAAATGAYLYFRPSNVSAQATVTTARVTRGTIASYVSAVGNLEAHRSVDLSFGQSGTVQTIDVQLGGEVKAGDVLAELDTTELELQLRSAEVSLKNAQLNLAEAQTPATEAEIATSRAAYESAQATHDDLAAGPSATELAVAQASVASAQAAYNSAVAAANAGDSSLASAAASLEKARLTLQEAQGAYDRVSWRGDVAASSQAAALQTATLDYNTAKASYESTAATSGTDTASKVASALASLRSAQANLADLKNQTTEADLASARAAVLAAQEELDTLLAGLDATAVAQARNSVETAEINLEQVKLQLEGARIVAPFDGVITAVNITVGESASGAAFTLADLSNLEIVVSMAETDVNQIQSGQDVEITLDAVADLTLHGAVSQIAPAGTQSSGVVTYPVTVALTEANEAARAGMTANLNIILAQRENVLTVPNKYVKTAKGQKVVTINTGGTQVQVPVEVGLTDDTHTEIVSGLNEGDTVVSVSTASSGTASTETQTRPGGGMMGGMLGGGMPGGAPPGR